MSSSQANSPVAFDTFWRWLMGHRSCVVQVSTSDVLLRDHDLTHWDIFETRDGEAVCQLSLGKEIIGELTIDPKAVLIVHASPDPDDEESGRWIFDCLTGPAEDAYTFCSFMMAHGMDQARTHTLVKH
jgi:hypothetical protein